MGHYLSEMEGPPFTTCNILYTAVDQDILKWARKQLRKQKLEFAKVVEVKEEWITENSERCWIEILYKSSKYNSNCVAHVDYKEYLEYKRSKMPPIQFMETAVWTRKKKGKDYLGN